MISNLIKNFNRKEVDVGTYLTFKSSTPMTITPNYTNSGVTLQYSLDKVTWNNITAKAATPSSDVIYFRGSATGTKSLFTDYPTDNAWVFTNATNLEVHGDITMLLQDSLGDMVRDIPLGSYAFASMFYNCTSLTTAPALPATTLADICYFNMFRSTSLTTAPALPATTLAVNCYYGMFRDCTKLTTAPALPATKLANGCYDSMFFKCTSLTTAPALPATKLANGCYSSMFGNCTSLTTAPALPATTLAIYCYNSMFFGCTKLTTAPALPATTLASYCYFNMFYNCTKLTTAPALPATTLASYCYTNMFMNCTSLTTTPALPATTLAVNCYNTMFSNCTKIKLSTTKTGGYVNEYRVPTVGTGVDASNALTNMFVSTSGTFTGTPTINTTYYTENTIV